MRRINFSSIIMVLITLFAILALFDFINSPVEAKENKPLKVAYKDLSPTAKKQVECLAQNMYYEAGWEPEKGQIAVAMVTINRVEDGRFANSICGVVKQKTQNTCQFTWFCERKALTKVNHSVYNDIKDLAAFVYANHQKINDPSKGALYYHADYVNPGWRNMVYLTKIGRHKFYNRKDA